MTTIILGIFGQYFDKMTRETGSIEFFGFHKLGISDEIRKRNVSNLGIIESAMDYADRINFLLDDVKLPLDTRYSVTCSELDTLFMRGFETKTTFWVGGSKVDTERVVEVFKSVKDHTLSFNDIKFNTNH